ncbi:MAG TPA: TMEM165/GDT1 family protein [Pyrinomonadaceae bacterium]|nr:TMEM165/GDT1 family protein [Pyrinomonadaceae bacterium]
MLVVFFATFGAVFIAEIVGDKLLYTTGVLAARYRTAPIMIGMVAAFMAKMGVAVLIGEVIARLPRLLVAAITAASFVGVAIALWRKDDEYRHERDQHKAHKVAMISFAAIFFSEWGDVGQVTAAAMAAKYHVALVVWLGAVAAMVTKGSLATFPGAGIRRWIHDRVSPKVVRYVGVGLLLLLGVLSVWEIMYERL